MPLAGFVLHRLLVAAFVTASAYALGRRLLSTRRLRFQSFAETVSVSTGVGFGTLGTLILVLGLCGLLYRSAVLALLLACHLVGWSSWRSAATRLRGIDWRTRPVRRFALGAVVVLGLAAPLIWRALYPPVQFDAIMYHLPAAREFAASHRVSPLPTLRFVVFPQLNEMLFCAAMLLCDDVTAQLLELVLCALACGAMLAWARRFGPAWTGPAALVLWIASPAVPFLSTSAYVEIAVALFAILAIHGVSCWRETRDSAWLIVSGLCAGFAAGTKYQGLFFVAAIPVALLSANRGREGWRAVVSFSGAAAAAALPWYARNLIAARSPVWPFLGEVFGYRFWTARDVASMQWSLHSFGSPRTIWGFLSLPWTLFHRPADAEVLRVLFLLLPVSLFAGFRSSRLRWIAGLTLGYFLFWFLTSQQLRFLVPVLPALCLLTAAPFAALFGRLPTAARRVRVILGVGAVLVLILALPAVARPYAWMRAQAPPRTAAERDAFLSSRFPSYPFYAQLNARQTRYTVYAFHDETMKYYALGTQLGDWFGLGRYADVTLDTGRGLYDSLERLSADYLLLNEEAVRIRLPGDSDFDSRFTPIYRNGPITAFRIRRGAMDRPLGRE